MKSKKLISFLCAAALTVSSFAGLTISANAATGDLGSQNFETATATTTSTTETAGSNSATYDKVTAWANAWGLPSTANARINAYYGSQAQANAYFDTVAWKQSSSNLMKLVSGYTPSTVTAPSNTQTKSLYVVSKQGEGAATNFDIPSITVSDTSTYDVAFDMLLVSADYDNKDEAKKYTFGIGDGTSSEVKKMAQFQVTDDVLSYYDGSSAVATSINNLTTAGTWFHFDIKLDSVSHKYKGTITPYNGDDLVTSSAVAFPWAEYVDKTGSAIKTFSFEAVRDAVTTKKGAIYSAVDNFTVTKADAITTQKVTINFKSGSTVLKDPVEVQVETGTNFTAGADYKVPIVTTESRAAHKYYKYDTTSTDTVTNVTAASEITLNFTETAMPKTAINAVWGDSDTLVGEITSNYVLPGEKVEGFAHEYMKGTDDKWYKKVAVAIDDKNPKNYAVSATGGEDDVAVKVKYEPAYDVVYFKEGEAFENASTDESSVYYSSGTYPLNGASGGLRATIPKGETATYADGYMTDTLPAGDYEITVAIYDSDGKRGIPVGTLLDSDIAHVNKIGEISGTGLYTKSFNATLTGSNAKFYVGKCNAQSVSTSENRLNAPLDYIVVKDTSVSALPEATIETFTYTKDGKKVSLTHDQDRTVPVTVIHASYAGGALSDVETYVVDVASGATATTQALAKPVAEGDKIMIWDALNGLKPYKPAITIDGTNADDVTPPATTYAVTVASGIANGTVTATPNTAVAEGTEVNVTAEPAQGYELATLTYTKGTDSPVDIKGTKKFNMPAGDVTINATFTATSSTPTKTDVTAATLTAAYDATAGKVTAALSAVDPEAATNAFTIAWFSGDAENAVTTPGAGTGAEITSPTPGKYYKAVATISDNATYNDKTVESNVVFVPYPTYTVGGTITGTGITSVTLTGTRTRDSEAVNTSATPSEGAYSFTVEAGTYTITPEFVADDYAVTPANYENVAVSADDNTKNFTVTPKLKGTVNVTSAEDFKAGKALTAALTESNASDSLHYAWQYKATAEGTYADAAGATDSATYTPAAAGYVKVTVTADGYDSSVASSDIEIIDASAATTTITIAKHASVTDVKVDNKSVEETSGNYVFTVTQNATHTVTASPAKHYKDVVVKVGEETKAGGEIAVGTEAVVATVTATAIPYNTVTLNVTADDNNTDKDTLVTLSGVTDNEAEEKDTITVDAGAAVAADYSVAVTADNDVTPVQGTEANVNKWTFTMPDGAANAITVTAALKKLYSVTSETGTFAGSLTKAAAGDVITFTPTAVAGKNITGVEVQKASDSTTVADATKSGSDYTYTMAATEAIKFVTIYADKAATVKLTNDTLVGGTVTATATANTGAEGAATAVTTTGISVPLGKTVTAKAVPAEGYKVASITIKTATEELTGTVTDTTNGATATYDIVDADDGETYTVTATFAKVDYTISGTGKVTVSSVDQGTVTLTKIGTDESPSGTTANAGQEVSFTVAAESGYQIKSVKVINSAIAEGTDGREVSTTADNTTYTFTMPAGNVSIEAVFEEKVRVKYDTYLVGAQNAPVTFATDEEKALFSKGGSTGSATYVAATETEPAYVNLTTGGNSFYYYNGTSFTGATGIVGINFDYMPKSAGMVLNIDDASKKFNEWTNYTTIAELRETALVYQGETIASLTKDEWNTIDIKFDLQLGTITFTVGDNASVTKPLIGTGGGKFQSNAIVTPASFGRLQVNPYNKSTGTGYLTNLTIGTINRTDALPETKTLTVAKNGTIGDAYIGETGTTTKTGDYLSTVTATAVGSNTARFDGWTSNKTAGTISTEKTITRRLYEDETLTANFTQLYAVALTYKVNDTAVEGLDVTIGDDKKTTDANGLVTFYLENGSYTATTAASAGNYLESSTALTVSDDGITQDVALTADATKTANIKISTSVEGAKVVLTDSESVATTAFTDVNGDVTFENKPSESTTYTYAVTMLGYANKDGSVTLEATDANTTKTETVIMEKNAGVLLVDTFDSSRALTETWTVNNVNQCAFVKAVGTKTETNPANSKNASVVITQADPGDADTSNGAYAHLGTLTYSANNKNYGPIAATKSNLALTTTNDGFEVEFDMYGPTYSQNTSGKASASSEILFTDSAGNVLLGFKHIQNSGSAATLSAFSGGAQPAANTNTQLTDNNTAVTALVSSNGAVKDKLVHIKAYINVTSGKATITVSNTEKTLANNIEVTLADTKTKSINSLRLVAGQSQSHLYGGNGLRLDNLIIKDYTAE